MTAKGTSLVLFFFILICWEEAGAQAACKAHSSNVIPAGAYDISALVGVPIVEKAIEEDCALGFCFITPTSKQVSKSCVTTFTITDAPGSFNTV